MAEWPSLFPPGEVREQEPTLSPQDLLRHRESRSIPAESPAAGPGCKHPA
jgi:hypothetical protein